MTQTGFYQKRTDEGEKTYRNCKFESTGIKGDEGKVIWRKIRKDGTPSNFFAEQFNPNVPWCVGKWFCALDSGYILRKYPQLKVETERAKTMTHEEYCDYLTSIYR